MGAARRSLPRRRFEAGVTVRLAPQPCPKCAPTIDAASVPLKFDELIAPVPGDLTVCVSCSAILVYAAGPGHPWRLLRSEEHTSELQSLAYLVCRLLLEK